MRGLLFDKDGVLFDFQASWGVWAHRMIVELSGGDAALAGRLADALDYDLASRRFRPESRVIAGTAREVTDMFAGVLTERSADDLHRVLVAGATEAEMVPTTDLAALFGALKAGGHPLGLATNDTEETARAQLEAEGCLDLFDFVAGSDSGFGAKPEPGMCLAFAEATSLNPGQCIMTGDSTHDLRSGRAAGFACIGVLTGVAGHADLAPMADAVLPSIADLPGWLGEN